MFLNWCLVVCLAFVYFYVNALPRKQEITFEIIYEKVEVVWYNHNYARDIQVLCYWANRTQRACNASGYVTLQNSTNNAVGELQLYKFVGNEYKQIPVHIASNLCEDLNKNKLGLQERLKNCSNIQKCPLQPGFYYVQKFWPDFSRLPPFIPRGRYKAVGKLYHAKEFVGEGHAYGSVADKVKNG